MPVRIVCPSCSAALSVKDELAGRALKCPKCGGTIPASQTGGSGTSPPPAPRPAFEEVTEPTKAKTGSKVTGVPAPRVKAEEDEQPAKAKTGSKVTGQPAPRVKKDDDDEEDEDRPRRKKRDDDDEDEDRPRRKKRDDDEDEDRGAKNKKRNEEDEDEEDRPRRKKRDDDEDEEDRGAKNKKSKKGEDEEDEEGDEERPTKKRKKQDDEDEDEDEDDDRPRGKKKKKKGGKMGLIIGIVAGVLLLCCGGGVGLTWYFISKVGDELNPKNDKVTHANYEKIKHGMTRKEVEAILGPGKLATETQLTWISNGATTTPGPMNTTFTKTRQEMWNPKITLNRVYYWQNDTDGIFIAFHPDASVNGRVQMMEFMTPGKYDSDLGFYRDDKTFETLIGKKK